MNNHVVADKEAHSESEPDPQQETTETEAVESSDSEVAAPEDDDASHADGPKSTKAAAGGRRLSISVKTLAASAVVLLLVVAIGVLTWLYLGARSDLANQSRQIAENGRAEQTALDYAVNAAVMDYKDLGPWKQKLVAGTTPELGEKLTKAAEAMEQIVLPLQWTSSAKPIAAKVRTHDNGVYVVDAFVSVMTKTVQANDNLQSTATYSVTINPNDSWRITDVGGIGAVAGGN